MDHQDLIDPDKLDLVPDRKIDPSRRPFTRSGPDGSGPDGSGPDGSGPDGSGPGGTRPDGTPDDNDRVEIGPTKLAFDEFAARGITPPDMPKLREYRLERIRTELRKRDLAGILLFDPLNIRYATDSTNMMLWTAHNLCRACFIATEGPVVLWDFRRCDFLSEHLPLITERRDGAGFFYFVSGEHADGDAKRFCAEIADLMRLHGGGNKRLAVDKIEMPGFVELTGHGLELHNGQRITEIARLYKDANEINAVRCAVAACEAAIEEMRAAFEPGITEAELWAHLHFGNIKRGGEWIETRILASGPRTNPWFQECGPRVIQNGDLMGFDTDMVGVYAYCCDISRTWICGDKAPTDDQKRAYQVGYEHIQRNLEMFKPGVTFEELVFGGHKLPDDMHPRRYSVKSHGVGLCDEYPSIPYADDYDRSQGSMYPPGADTLLPGMCLTVEVFAGSVNGGQGVKLEDQVVITEDGYENLTTTPFEDRLMG
ncbi:MAG: Xaa-Pro peptidase family protein [Alphaproteobacteria bacterium]|nr:Xaa-Pro peptidase family protein [Alphaproteobacteria bacterium]